ncbi:MAG TPA: PBP1A family penicillin-binding protein [Candidatus Cloacimonadota bacterium]|jgi:penicillin-binding protein 1A|nr:PBP1A family penicillin-binding protein [Candidatus Cloacimonadales bacterium]HPY95624.1 PBP1A family penicillin-binding protein [Candidatus Cloacimonadota bacterium]HQB40192.1 PBP1A family penicillin-binding protein [Candidatus Cloacimonadota bacterium]
MKKQIFKYLKFLIGITIFILGMIAGIFYFFSKELPPMEDVQSYRINSGSEVYDCNNNLIHVFQMENRRLTSFDKLPSHLVNALITVEDANFYKHWGVDVFAMFRAVIVDLASWNFAQGGSTITQQLARNMFLNLDKKMTRKIKEAMLAVLIERYFTKEEILEIYFNKIYFGDGVYGVETAAHKYFGKTVQDISIAEAALLVGMIQRPNYYSPIKNPKQSTERRNFVLKKMYKSSIISSTQYESALTENIEIAQSRFIDNLNSNYFIDYIRIKLEREYGTEQLFTGAMRIYATIDYDLQVYADSVLNEQFSILENNKGYRKKYKDYPALASNISSDYLQGGVYAIDPNTGYVKVMIGGRNFNHSKFNRITQAKRQAGSAFKPLLYTAAIEKGYTPSTIIHDRPVVFKKNNQVYWEPKNYDKTTLGYVTLRDALKKSLNISAAKVIYDIGPNSVVKVAENFGLTTNIPPYLSIAVGSCEVIPSQLISSFGIFASGGVKVEPIYYTKVVDSKGKVLEERKPNMTRVLDPKVAWLMTDLLKSVVNSGTAASIRSYGFYYPCAGKTGTTDDYRDSWFIGYTPRLVLGVWGGFDNNKTMGSGMTGSVVTVPVWTSIAKKAYADMATKGININEDFVKPQGIVEENVSKVTGFLANYTSSSVIKEYYIEGTEPTTYSDSLNYNFFPSKIDHRNDSVLNVREISR